MKTPKKNVSNLPVEGMRKRTKLTSRTSSLSFPEIPGYSCRLVLVDDPNRIGRKETFENDLAYSIVDPAEVGIYDGTSIVTRPAGKGKTFVLMKTPIEEYEAAKIEKRNFNEMKRRKETQSRDGQFSSFTEESNFTE